MGCYKHHDAAGLNIALRQLDLPPRGPDRENNKSRAGAVVQSRKQIKLNEVERQKQFVETDDEMLKVVELIEGKVRLIYNADTNKYSKVQSLSHPSHWLKIVCLQHV